MLTSLAGGSVTEHYLASTTSVPPRAAPPAPEYSYCEAILIVKGVSFPYSLRSALRRQGRRLSLPCQPLTALRRSGDYQLPLLKVRDRGR